MKLDEAKALAAAVSEAANALNGRIAKAVASGLQVDVSILEHATLGAPTLQLVEAVARIKPSLLEI